VNLEAVRDAGVDLLEKIQKLGGSVALVAFADGWCATDICRSARS
jgi:hypothetical protein